LSFVVWISISVIKSPVPFDAFYVWAKIAAEFLIFLTIANTICEQIQVKKIILVVLAASAIPCIVGIYQLIIRDPTLQHVTEVWGAERAFYRIRGTMAHAMTFGDFLGLMIIFYSILLIELYHMLSHRLRAILIGALACWGVLLINTYTRSSWIAVIIGISLYNIVTKRYRLLMLFGGLVLLIGLLFPNVVLQRFQDVLYPSEYGGNSLLDRLALWRLALMNAGENIVTGKGSGAFLETSRMELGHTEAVHNIYIQTLFELGIVGLLLLLWLQLSIITCAVRNCRKMKSVAYRAVSLAFLTTYVAFGIITPLMANRLGSPSISWYMFALCGLVTCLPTMEERCSPSVKIAQVGTQD
jgi:O-antigen ligase